MPVQRRSCERCFRGKRRCDATYPSCNRCHRNGQSCFYRRLPENSALSDTASQHQAVIVSAAQLPSQGIQPDDSEHLSVTQLEYSMRSELLLENDGFLDMLENFVEPDMFVNSVPSMVGLLGDVQPLSGTTKSWDWVLDQLRSYPDKFATSAENVFIQRTLYEDKVPVPISQAFGLCTASLCANNKTRHMFLRSLNDTIAELLGRRPADDGDLLDDLGRLQALLMCEILRLSYGDVEERLLTEQQQSLMETRAMQLLQKMKSEQLLSQAVDWKTWVVHESVRRTVMLMFLLHGVHSISNHGICLQISTLGNLPISLKTALWDSRSGFLKDPDEDTTLRYHAFTEQWLSSPIRHLDPFERLVLVACKGLDCVSDHSHSAITC